MVPQRMRIQPIRNSFLLMRAKRGVFDARLQWQGMMNLYKRSIFIITQTQFATQTQVT